MQEKREKEDETHSGTGGQAGLTVLGRGEGGRWCWEGFLVKKDELETKQN